MSQLPSKPDVDETEDDDVEGKVKFKVENDQNNCQDGKEPKGATTLKRWPPRRMKEQSSSRING